jgi:hypothetical protein
MRNPFLFSVSSDRVGAVVCLESFTDLAVGCPRNYSRYRAAGGEASGPIFFIFEERHSHKAYLLPRRSPHVVARCQLPPRRAVVSESLAWLVGPPGLPPGKLLVVTTSERLDVHTREDSKGVLGSLGVALRRRSR